MKKLYLIFIFFLFLISCSLTGKDKKTGDSNDNSGEIWRSSLYPENWYPGYSDSQGRYLHDFSYAGYKMGETEIPSGNFLPVLNVTDSPYNADNTGSTDTTLAIQQAIYDAGTNGGGIVYLPEGIYLVKPQYNNIYGVALRIRDNNVVLRGDGPDKTFILNTKTFMRSSSIIRVNIDLKVIYWDFWTTGIISRTGITSNYNIPTKSVTVADITGFNNGDWIVISEDCNNAMINDLSMTGEWNEGDIIGPKFYRKIISISGNTINFDIPTRFKILDKYNPTVYKLNASHLENVGIEEMAFGMIENPGSSLGDLEYDTEGTAAYEVHAGHVIDYRFTVNGWIKNVETFKPVQNIGDYHILSNGIRLTECRNITIENCDFRNPQYEGEGGNGYMYILRGNDCLIKNSSAVSGRHNYDFKTMTASGNVILKSLAKDSRYPSDFHMYLSMANLFDSMTMDCDFIEGMFRPYTSLMHGQTTTESVFWNTAGLNYHSTGNFIIKSQQWGWGYVIGTQGPASDVYIVPDQGRGVAPDDFLEGEGIGDTLEPPSLYEDQLNKRID